MVGSGADIPTLPRRPEGVEEGGARPVHRRACTSPSRRTRPTPRSASSSRSCATSRSTSSPPTTPWAIAASRRRSCRSPWSGRSASWRISPSTAAASSSASSTHAPSGVGRRVRREDLGAVLSQVRPQPPGRHRGPRGNDQAGAHARQHRRRHRPPAERGDAEADGGARGFTPRRHRPRAPLQTGRSDVALSAAILDRYVGEYTTPAGAIVTFRREGTTLFVKLPGANPEVPLGARSEIRFGDPQARVFEFHVDGQGKVTGALMEQGPQPLKLLWSGSRTASPSA